MTTTEPTTETAAAPVTSKPIDARALLKDIHSRFDVFRNHSPLAIGIDRQILAQLPELEKKALRLAMRSHTISTRYLKEMEKGTGNLQKARKQSGETAKVAASVNKTFGPLTVLPLGPDPPYALLNGSGNSRGS